MAQLKALQYKEMTTLSSGAWTSYAKIKVRPSTLLKLLKPLKLRRRSLVTPATLRRRSTPWNVDALTMSTPPTGSWRSKMAACSSLSGATRRAPSAGQSVISLVCTNRRRNRIHLTGVSPDTTARA
jgi:hypothetical protein